ncbi:hypothetical protein LDP10_02790 [Buchnera aphidicola (Pemphigus obesinymphae)]|uniref:RepA family replication protein n=1 Tax=Buchnera aphidicola TaxID=9 RepID=UPI0039C91543|nr:hypothetical protein [Buchnera aphidicola (Pemphigus obesinymphae)]
MIEAKWKSKEIRLNSILKHRKAQHIFNIRKKKAQKIFSLDEKTTLKNYSKIPFNK